MHNFAFNSAKEIRYGQDPVLDALLLHFMTENSLEHSIDPENATPEQIRFIVSLDEDSFYAPCGDWMLHFLLKARLDESLRNEYADQWNLLVRTVCAAVPKGPARRRILHLCRHKFRMTLKAPILIPSRLLKRMLTIFLALSGIPDPFQETKRAMNRRAQAFLESSFYNRLVNVCPDEKLECVRITDLRFELDLLEMARLLFFSTHKPFWTREDPTNGLNADDMRKSLERVDFSPLRTLFATERGSLRILYLPRASGGILMDLKVVRSLLRQGHRVVLALKDGFYFDSPTVWDLESDPVLAEAFKDAYFLQSDRVTKNELLQATREHALVVISDGTRERFNPYRLSVTFARAWKECDLVLAKGEAYYRRFIGTSHEFTRDLLVFFCDAQGKFRMFFKAKPPHVHKFGADAILAKADAIISQMREARAEGKTVIFYSAVVGSIPGQVKTAIEVLNTFVNHLRSRLEGTFIINPGEHFEEGMDADDLMFMWERVQRSGFLNVWRFQTDADIEKSFELMGKRVPPIWAGKDSTYSTGCTKEMQIALSVQKRQPELQIIGPSPEKFLRRREYGVGRFSDVVVAG
ncbi:MAG: ARMT1-like domain-containing protein [Humidesulfovibrio sp.]|uniref:ARMT1-like domain-containing protein n=1 Tax=Humidesulfovibrio sp. TaxID=2910988 RepID=UPI00273417E0|nr:ARMT1-like domain-containing protein [Humidesulfovibrio sp.]MDP2847356.1 ARMT1-like domain-containing protein [Humidesulfovibrio sp.]